MTATRSRKQVKQYDRYRKKVGGAACEFCQLDIDKHSQVLRTTPSFKLIRNIFPYSVWDSQQVVDHLMIVPKQHTDTLKHLSDEQAAEFVQLISEYEEQGYNVYARAPKSSIKTVEHQHTHLIKTTGRVKFVFVLMKPYLRLFR